MPAIVTTFEDDLPDVEDSEFIKVQVDHNDPSSPYQIEFPNGLPWISEKAISRIIQTLRRAKRIRKVGVPS